MAVYSIWESRFPSGSAADGLQITTAIWDDMPGYDGYLGHEIVQDLDDPGHLLVAEPRRRFVAHQVHVGGSPGDNGAAE